MKSTLSKFAISALFLYASVLAQNAASAADSQQSSLATDQSPAADHGTSPSAIAAPPSPASLTPGISGAAKSDEPDSIDEEERKQVHHLPFYKHLLRKISFFKLSYYFVAQNPANCDLFYGLVVDNPMIGRASVDFVTANGCACHGVAQVTHYPLFKGGAGQRGYVKAKCSDGRTMKGKFTTTSVTTGNGTMTDSSGNQYQFTFGHTADQAVQEVNLLRKQLGCTEVTGQEIELKVHAEIMKKETEKTKN